MDSVYERNIHIRLCLLICVNLGLLTIYFYQQLIEQF